MHVVVETVNCIIVSCTRRTTSNGAHYSTVLKNNICMLMYVKCMLKLVPIISQWPLSVHLFYFWFQICCQKALHDLQGGKNPIEVCWACVKIWFEFICTGFCVDTIYKTTTTNLNAFHNTKHTESCFSQIRLRRSTHKLWKLFFGFLFFHLEKKIRSIKMIVCFQNGWNLLAVDRLM